MTTALKPALTLTQFCALVRDRSAENQQAFTALMDARLFGPALGIVRQELDSLVRVLYLLALSSRTERQRLMESSVQGKHWTRKTAAGKWVRITDREMVDLAILRHRWIEQVYAYGCNLIHLSDWHTYRHADPTDNLDSPTRTHILRQLEAYHSKRLAPLSFQTLLMHAPHAMSKISSNLECYLKDLEKR